MSADGMVAPTPMNSEAAQNVSALATTKQAEVFDDSSIGSRIKSLRGEMSQSELGDRMRRRGFKWSQATVWDVERGKRPLRLTEAFAVAEFLRSSIEEITTGYQSAPSDYARGFDAGVASIKSAIFEMEVGK